MKVKLANPYFDEREISAVKKVMDSGCTAGTCSEVRRYENAFRSAVNTKFAAACSSCTAGLHVSLLAVGVGPGDEVLVPDFTHPASGFAVMHCGATPVLVDVDRKTYTIDTNDIESKITTKTKAIMPVYPFGMPPDVDEINEIATSHDFATVGDAACALGATHHNAHAGHLFDVECFSTYAIKVISTGEGGMVTTNNGEIADKVYALIDFGKTGNPMTFGKLGYNYRLSAIQAAIGICQLDKLDDILEDRLWSTQYYYRLLGEIGWLRMQKMMPYARSSWQRMVCVNESRKPTHEIIDEMKAFGVEATIGTFSLCRQPVFKMFGKCPTSSKLFDDTISLPLYHKISTSDIEYVVDCLKKIKVD